MLVDVVCMWLKVDGRSMLNGHRMAFWLIGDQDDSSAWLT